MGRGPSGAVGRSYSGGALGSGGGEGGGGGLRLLLEEGRPPEKEPWVATWRGTGSQQEVRRAVTGVDMRGGGRKLLIVYVRRVGTEGLPPFSPSASYLPVWRACAAAAARA